MGRAMWGMPCHAALCLLEGMNSALRQRAQWCPQPHRASSTLEPLNKQPPTRVSPFPFPFSATNAYIATYVLAFICTVLFFCMGVAMISNRKSFGGQRREREATGLRASCAGAAGCAPWLGADCSQGLQTSLSRAGGNHVFLTPFWDPCQKMPAGC